MNNLHHGNAIVIWLGLAAFAWSMLFVWQGLDFTDMGFWLTGYQQLYTHPDTFPASCWLTSFIGHWAGLAMGGGVLSYRLGYVIVITTSAIITYRLLASRFGHSHMLAAMVLLTTFFTKAYGTWIGYNELTALFYLTGAALLFCGLVDNRKFLVMMAGVVLGANFFVRFPNLLGITLVSAIWLQAWAYRWTLRDILAGSSWFLGGYALGVALVWGLIVLHGHEAIYFQGIQALFSIAVDDSSHHSGSGLLKLFISDHVLAFAEALSIVIIGCWITNWIYKQKRLMRSVVILAGALLLTYVNYIHDHSRWSITGLCYIVLLSIVFREFRKDPPLALLAFIAGMVLLLAPLGSNRGIYNSVFGMWLALPLTLIWLWRSSDLAIPLWYKVSGDGFEPKSKFLMEARGFRVFTITIILALFFQSLASGWQYTFRDNKNRFAMTHSIAHPLLVGIYTTAERAKVVAELLDAMSHYTKPGDEVLAYNEIPTVHFLTETHPWLGGPWPEIVGTKKVAAMIRQKEQTGARLPYIVRATFNTNTGFTSWPQTAVEPVNTTPLHQVFTEFEQRHGYVVVWSNNFFEILATAQ